MVWRGTDVLILEKSQSSPSLQVFFYAMLTYPEYQKRAQSELGRVVGSSRLPTLEDKPNLPYIEAILKEVLRWKPVTPLGRDAIAPSETPSDP